MHDNVIQFKNVYTIGITSPYISHVTPLQIVEQYTLMHTN